MTGRISPLFINLLSLFASIAKFSLSPTVVQLFSLDVNSFLLDVDFVLMGLNATAVPVLVCFAYRINITH